MKILILNTETVSNNFLSSQLRVESYLNLYVQKETYGDKLCKQLNFYKNADYCLHAKVNCYDDILNQIPESVKQLGDKVDLLYYDMGFFPLVLDKLNLAIDKCSYSNMPVRFYVLDEQDRKCILPMVYINSIKSLYAEFKGDFLEQNVTNLLIDLSKPKNLINLFSNNINSRYFNTVKNKDAFFEKESNSKNKIQAEYNYLNNIPSNIRPYYPNVGSLNLRDNNASYEIEKIYALDGARHLINHSFNDEDILNNFFQSLSKYINLLPTRKVTSLEFHANFMQHILQKNAERLLEVQQLEFITTLEFICKNAGFKSFADLCKHIDDKIIARVKKEEKKVLCFSHGDLCLSNILYDSVSSQIKFIDPKGYINNIDETYRSLYYDLAKLSHSILGLYDLLVNNLADAKLDDDAVFTLEYKQQYGTEYIQKLKQAFCDFIQNLGYDLKFIRLIEASLFTSMLALHKDSEKKMCMLLIQGIKTLQASDDAS